MSYILITNAAVSLIMGVALVLVWRRDRSQTFTRYIGFANLVQLLVPLTYWWMDSNMAARQLGGALFLSIVAAAYTTLLVLGSAQLANRSLPSHWIALLMAGMSLITAIAAYFGGIRLGQASMATFNTLVEGRPGFM